MIRTAEDPCLLLCAELDARPYEEPWTAPLDVELGLVVAERDTTGAFRLCAANRLTAARSPRG